MTKSTPPLGRPGAVALPDLAHPGAHGHTTEGSGVSGRIVNRYQTGLPGVACGIAAVAMAAMTLGLLVVAPAAIGPGSEAERSLPAPQPLPDVVTAAAQQSAAKIEPGVGCDKANRSRLPETRCPQDPGAHRPAKSDSGGVGCLDVS